MKINRFSDLTVWQKAQSDAGRISLDCELSPGGTIWNRLPVETVGRLGLSEYCGGIRPQDHERTLALLADIARGVGGDPVLSDIEPGSWLHPGKRL